MLQAVSLDALGIYFDVHAPQLVPPVPWPKMKQQQWDDIFLPSANMPPPTSADTSIGTSYATPGGPSLASPSTGLASLLPAAAATMPPAGRAGVPEGSGKLSVLGACSQHAHDFLLLPISGDMRFLQRYGIGLGSWNACRLL